MLLSSPASKLRRLIDFYVPTAKIDLAPKPLGVLPLTRAEVIMLLTPCIIPFRISSSLSALGQAKLIASFLFQDFQNMMRAGGHYSLFIIILYNNESSVHKTYTRPYTV